jgi:hypothetical protein
MLAKINSCWQAERKKKKNSHKKHQKEEIEAQNKLSMVCESFFH